MPHPLASALAAGPLVLDGGLGTLLEERGNDLSDALWSARILLDRPDEVRAAHEEFFRAGARVAISGSYQVGYEPLAREGFDQEAVDALIARSVLVAREARSAVGLADPGSAAADADVAWVVASVGPFGAVRADGSEYSGDYGLSVDELAAWHRPRLRALAATGADALAAETIPSLAEVEALVRELDALGGEVPAWISVTVAEGALRSGESLEEAFALAASSDAVVAVGVNCCDPRDVLGAAEAAARVTSKPFVAYPNSGEQWDAKNRRWMGHPGVPQELVHEWLDAGVALVGGCCRVVPDAIREIADVVGERR
ncbi:homocysteine S-methyltransferase [Homoserinibacter sp. GY 40078]|uniref:homocysteine S-methyltransferase n=1 Tax=Homoserinibacter sp. GY 40078 TaxID=2603275 RepID=UPI0011C9CA1F|nr:homocysteine S-methyltransferase [Homoserinibacter sp. GY 40078]TXK19760.1 homocysteine S-methyltransferase [Homoserinibacter sp. GY 40078]